MSQQPRDPGDSITIGGDLVVNRLGFGAMHLAGSGVWGEPPNPREARNVLHRVVERGITFIDTADAYGPDVNERVIADALHPYPEGLVIATKGGLVRPHRAAWNRNGGPDHLRAACEGSLKKLKADRIDLYQLHAPDPRVPIEDSVGVLADMRAEGKIRHVGLSNVDVDELRRAQRIVPIVSVQNRFNLGDRSSGSVLKACAKENIAFLPWGPLGGSRFGSANRWVAAIAKRHGATPTQVAIAWLLALSPVMLPIPGTSSMAHLEENVAAAGLGLSPSELAELT